MSNLLDPLLEALDCIENEGIKFFTITMLNNAPESFFVMPSGPPEMEDYIHPPDEDDEGGNILHTLRVHRATRVIAYTCGLDQDETDILASAALLHDAWKYDMYGNYQHYHSFKPDELIEEFIDNDSAFSEEEAPSTMEISREDLEKILRLVRTHHGIYSLIPETEPSDPMEFFFAIANNMACNLSYLLDGDNPKPWRWSLDF